MVEAMPEEPSPQTMHAACDHPADAGAMLVNFLRHRDVSCPCCGYNLRNLTAPMCPECHESISLKVDVQHRPLHWLLIALVPHMFSAGVSVMFLFFVIQRGWPRMHGVEKWGTYALFLSAAIGIAIAVYHRRFLRFKPDAQLMYLVLNWIAHVVLLIAVTTH